MVAVPKTVRSPAVRPHPKNAAKIVGNLNHLRKKLSIYATAGYAPAIFGIASVCRSSRTSRSSSLMLSFSLVSPQRLA